MTRYLLAVDFRGGVVETPMSEWKPEEITAHLDYYEALHNELVSSGELLDSQVLTGPDLAKIVTSDGTAPVVTDGPFLEFEEVARRLPDRGRGVGGAGDRDRREGLCRPGTRRGCTPAADPGATGDGRSPVRRRRDRDVLLTGE